jgi:hypothetical protein
MLVVSPNGLRDGVANLKAAGGIDAGEGTLSEDSLGDESDCDPFADAPGGVGRDDSSFPTLDDDIVSWSTSNQTNSDIPASK